MVKPQYPNLKNIRKVLVIKLRHLGDVLLTTPVFTNLKKNLPDAEIDAYIWKEAHPILEGLPAISNYHLYDRKWKELSPFSRYRHELAILRQMRAKKYDLVINLTEGDRGALVAKLSNAPLRVGVDPGKSGFLGKRKIYTHLVKTTSNPRHTVERDLDALRRIGIFPDTHERDLSFACPVSNLTNMRNLLEKEGLKPGEFTLIHPVSRWLFKTLPPPLIAAIIERLNEPVILTGGPSLEEREMLAEIVSLCKKPVLNLGGKTSLKDLAALMTLSKGLITVDSVALHIASALKIPTAALFGPTSEQNWGPWNNPRGLVIAQKKECRPCRLDGCGGSKRSDCLWTMSPDVIVQAYNSISQKPQSLKISFV